MKIKVWINSPENASFEAFGQQPILGDMRSKTKWSVFIKEEY